MLLSGLPAESSFAAAVYERHQETDWRAALDRATGREPSAGHNVMSLDEFMARGKAV